MSPTFQAAARLAAVLSFAFALAVVPITGRAQSTAATTQPAPAATQAATVPNTQAPPITLELNKLEALPAAQSAGAGCRVYMVASNQDGPAIDALRLDLVIFNTDGVIARRVAVDLGPLPPKKTSVRLFDLAGQNCDEIGRMLVNDVMLCQMQGSEGTADQQRAACLGRVVTSSRAKAPLTK
jgi:hypothetical protein